MKQFWREFLADDTGATAIEYALIAGLIAGLIALVIMGALTTVGTKLNAAFGNVSNSLS